MILRQTGCGVFLSILLLAMVAGATSTGDSTRESLAEMARLLQTDRVKALPAARTAFESWVKADPGNPSRQALRQRMEALQSLRDRILQALHPAGNAAVQNLVDGLVAATPGHSSTPAASASGTSVASPEELYAEYLPYFVYRLDMTGLSTAEIDFVRSCYSAQAQALIEEIMEAGIPLAAVDQAQPIEGYLLLLPLLQNPAQFDMRLLSALPGRLMTPDRLSRMADFCLLKAGRLDAAAGIGAQLLEVKGQDDAHYRYYVSAAEKCQASHQPGRAVQCLKEAAKLLKPDDPRIVEHRFGMCSMWSACKNYALAAGEAGQVAKEYRDTAHAGKARYLRIRYFAEQGDFKSVLQEADDAIQDKHCQPYMQELLYLKWVSLRKEGKGEQASQVLKRYLEAYPDSPYSAEMYYAVAVDCLSAQRYDEAHKILQTLVAKYPGSQSALRAKPLMEKLDKFAKSQVSESSAASAPH